MAKHIIKNVVVLIFLFCVNISFAQSKSVLINHNPADSLSSNTINSSADTSKFQMKKSAWGAVLRSTLLPGLGQFYNESYWKIPLVWGALGYLGYQWNANNNLYIQYRDSFAASITATNSNGNNNDYRFREFYKDQRDMFAVFIGLTFFLNLVDAYVDAQLFDFDVTNDMAPNTMKFSMRVRL